MSLCLPWYAVLHHVIHVYISRLWDLRRRSCETNWEKRSLDAKNTAKELRIGSSWRLDDGCLFFF